MGSRRRNYDPSTPFQTINETARITGLSASFIRAGCKAGTIPHIKTRGGKEYRVNVPLFRQQLEAASVQAAGR